MTSDHALPALEILEHLISFRTISSDTNLPFMSFVRDYLKRFGVETQLFPDKTGTKAALLAAIGPQDKPGIILSGHSDVVPVEGQKWQSDPFRMTIRDNKAFGRGTADMKSFLATCLGALPYLCAANLKQPVYFMFSYDEELNCLGSVDAINWLVRNRPLPEYAIVGEPTMMKPVDAHKNIAVFQTFIQGLEAHSAMPHLGASAVMAAGELIAGIGKITRELEERGDRSGRFDPPYSTLHVASVNGGGACNILARECRMEWELRGLPDQSADEIEKRVQKIAEQIVKERLTRFGPYGSIKTERILEIPGLDPEKDPRAARFVSGLVNEDHLITVSYGTEGGHFQAAGISTVICGPGSIDQAHKADEFMCLDQLEQGSLFMKKLVDALS